MKANLRREMMRSEVNFEQNTLTIQWNLYNPTPEFSDILCHPTNIYCPKVFLLTKIKPIVFRHSVQSDIFP